MSKSTISMAIFNSYVSLPEGTWHPTVNSSDRLPDLPMARNSSLLKPVLHRSLWMRRREEEDVQADWCERQVQTIVTSTPW